MSSLREANTEIKLQLCKITDYAQGLLRQCEALTQLVASEWQRAEDSRKLLMDEKEEVCRVRSEMVNITLTSNKMAQ